MEAPPQPPPPPPPVAHVAIVAPVDLNEETASHVFAAHRASEIAHNRAQMLPPLVPEDALDLSLSVDLAETTAASWSQSSGLDLSQGGSGGVVFVHGLQPAKSAVLKGSGEPAREVFATRLLRLLNIPTPQVRVICYSSLEWARVKETIARLGSGEARVQAEKSLNRPQLLLFEFVRGSSLLSVNPHESTSCWHDDKVSKRKRKNMGNNCFFFLMRGHCFVSFWSSWAS